MVEAVSNMKPSAFKANRSGSRKDYVAVFPNAVVSYLQSLFSELHGYAPVF